MCSHLDHMQEDFLELTDGYDIQSLTGAENLFFLSTNEIL